MTVVSRSELASLEGAAKHFAVPAGPSGAEQIASWEQDEAYKRTVIAVARRMHASKRDHNKALLLAYLDTLLRLYSEIKAIPHVRHGVYRDKILKKLRVCSF